MAQRFGGPYSPGGDPTRAGPAAPGQSGFGGKRPSRVGLRANLLLVLPLLFVLKGFAGGPSALILGVAAFALTLLGAFLTREGIRAHEAYAARDVARRPAIPRKIFAAVAIGLGLGAGALMSGQAAVIAALLGLLGAGLHLAAFGLDPMRDKGAEADRYQTDRVARAVEEAERMLAETREAIARTRDRALTDRVDRFAATARTMFRSVERDPRDLGAARRYLSVYLTGARDDATVKFADLQARRPDPGARAEYEALLTDLETNFASRTEALLSDDRIDLDVEVSVLRERLRRDN